MWTMKRCPWLKKEPSNTARSCSVYGKVPGECFSSESRCWVFLMFQACLVNRQGRILSCMHARVTNRSEEYQCPGELVHRYKPYSCRFREWAWRNILYLLAAIPLVLKTPLCLSCMHDANSTRMQLKFPAEDLQFFPQADGLSGCVSFSRSHLACPLCPSW